MGTEHRQTPIGNDNSARISAPPGFASLSAFFLKKVDHCDENENVEASKDSSTRDKVQAEAIDAKKLKKSVQNRPWILNETIDHIANEYLSVQPYKATRRQCPGGAKEDVLEEVPVFRPSEEEFTDTIKYIESIRLKVEPYGLCRIIPPPSWQPPCLIKEKSIWESSKFVTQIQQFDRFRDHSEKEEEPGPEFTLKRFKKHADDFIQYYFTSKHTDVGHRGNCKQGDPSVESIECEYRKIVENPTGRLEVLYGDLDTTTFGSGFPLVSKPRESCNPIYIQSGWNLNNVPTLPGSLLSFESDKTSGVLAPRLRVGMYFSSLSWKVEEHHLNSICYMHMGSPKIWYSVPGRYAFKFETLMKKYYPDFLSKQLKQCEGAITRLSPFVLKSEGVPVYRCIQYPREFVLVFSGAYHSTFDCGFNIAETVNFAPLDWLPHGQNAVALYQSQGRKTSISFDKLLIGAAREAVKAQWELSLLKKNTIDNLRWKGYCGKNGILAETLKSRVEQEGMRREYLCGSFQTKRKEKNFSSTGKKECSLCYFDLFLSAVHCPCSADRYSCLNHAKQLCSCTWTEKIFLYQYEMSELNVLVEAVEGKFSAVYTWAREDLNLGLHNYTPKENSFTEDKGQKEQKLQDAGTSYGNGWTAAASIKAEIKARIQQSQCPNGQKSKEKAVSTPLPSIAQDDTSLLLRVVVPEALSSSSNSVSSSSESDDTIDLDLIDGGEGCLLSTLNSRPSPSQRAREITLSSQRRPRESEITSSTLRMPSKREARLSEILKDKHGTAEHLKSSSEKLPKSPVSKRRKKK
ncbi:Transcription factor jumonji family protein / zinc finger family protein, putative isoform 2 [Hibiscus syriacus]|uniref:Transcription factor jumonji family protein / zinc finger family protein, putative isoform 2 n=1 Tax=Hibiscus syriacus TaxID=106335 RepID=A0A6A2XZN3_HIBSY|nr:putative lysine-specific demethylase JMJ16 [Hibiscus syriacus]XP_039048309.1 putative lysine-specific demethylase JMJ16 [Hibiscus syriacus]KAE8660414.1 Transcription factor jumonji family protein / zinc finger family protein, putative isoform 2 [Hibiscus syriacus]